jgi:GntR family transcriptional repressor for pyruvate dehydrogenase complex
VTKESRKLYQTIVDAILAAIGQGEYAPGKRLPSERELADRFGVSRPTVREAMIALEIRGVVEPRHGSGIYVTEAPRPEGEVELDVGAFELTEARYMIEGEAAAVAADAIEDAELAELEQILAAMIDENERHIEGEQADRRFHVAIAKATKNSAIVQVVEMLWDLRHRSPLCANMLERARQVGVQPRIDEHQAILEALKARDPQGARKAMRQHLSRVIDDLLKATETQALQQARLEVEAKRSQLARRASI